MRALYLLYASPFVIACASATNFYENGAPNVTDFPDVSAKSLRTRTLVDPSCDGHRADLEHILRWVSFLAELGVNAIPSSERWRSEQVREKFYRLLYSRAPDPAYVSITRVERAVARGAFERLLLEIRTDIRAERLGHPWGKVTICCEDDWVQEGDCKPRMRPINARQEKMIVANAAENRMTIVS